MATRKIMSRKVAAFVLAIYCEKGYHASNYDEDNEHMKAVRAHETLVSYPLIGSVAAQNVARGLVAYRKAGMSLCHPRAATGCAEDGERFYFLWPAKWK